MKIDISPELAERIQRLVDCGNYESIEIVLDKAVCLLEEDNLQYEKELAKVRAMLKEAEDDVKQGRYRMYTDENLHELFDEIKREGRKRSIKRLERKLAEAKSGYGSD